MLKRLKLYAALILVCCTFLLCFPVSAATTVPFLPLNIDAWLQDGDSGMELYVWAQNNTNATISQIVFSADIYDASGGLAGYSGDATRKFYGSAQQLFLPAHANEPYHWSLSNYQNPVAVGNIQLISVKFMNGNTWTYSPSVKYSYEPDFKLENETMADGRVEMYYDHSVHLFDTSLGSLSRDWYIWSDAENRWVWFSNEMAPDCYIWGPGASIKLVINQNPGLYAVKSFQVAMSPFITMRHMGDETAETKDKYALDADRVFEQAKGNWNVAFWDDHEYGQSRDWYFWDNEKNDWVWFSDSRGPAYKVSEEGSYSIKLVYDGDSQNYQIISFTAKRSAAPAESGGEQHEAA